MANTRNNILYAWSGVRQQFAGRRKFSEIARTLTVVIPLTLLIWIYAERAQQAESSVPVLIDVTIPEPTLTASILEPTSMSVDISMKGPRAEIEQLKIELQRLSMEQHLQLPLDKSLRVGDQIVEVLPLVRNLQFVRDHSVTIDSVSPPRIKVSIERMATRQIRVDVPSDSQIGLQRVVFDPPRVKITGPESAVNRIFNADQGKLSVDLNPIADTLTTQSGGKPVEVGLTPLPASARVTVTPTKVRMTYEVGSREEDYQISSVNIVVERPIALEGRVRVKPKGIPVIRNVTVHGPADQMTKLKGDNPAQRITAVLSITTDEAAGNRTDLQKPVTFEGLPPGITVTGGPYPVEFDILDGNSTDR